MTVAHNPIATETDSRQFFQSRNVNDFESSMQILKARFVTNETQDSFNQVTQNSFEQALLVSGNQQQLNEKAKKAKKLFNQNVKSKFVQAANKARLSEAKNLQVPGFKDLQQIIAKEPQFLER